MPNPFFSIIVPSYNQGQFLERCLKSIINQKIKDIEIIVIDGGSSDNSVDVIKKYESYLKYWVSEPDSGQSDAINKGLSQCNGQIINWLPCDDYLEHGSLNRIQKIFNNKNIDIYCGSARILENGNVITYKITARYSYSWPFTIVFGQIVQPATFWKREVFIEVTPLIEDLHYIMDGYIWMKYIVKYGFDRIYYDPSVVVANIDLQPDAKSVKYLPKFLNDWNYIMKTLHLSCAGVNSNDFFEVKIPEICSELNMIDFYNSANQLFVRSFKSKKIGIRYSALFKLLIFHFIPLLKFYFYKNRYFAYLRHSAELENLFEKPKDTDETLQ